MDIETPLLEESSQDDSAVMPQLRKLLTLACSDDTDEQIKVRKTCVCASSSHTLTSLCFKGERDWDKRRKRGMGRIIREMGRG